MSIHGILWSEEATGGLTYPTDDIIVVGKVRLAVLATVDLVGIQVDVVCKAHPEGRP